MAIEKTGSLGGDPEEGFESAFSQLAFAHIRDKAPRLMDHAVGFQLVERNEDNTRALGVFGFLLGDMLVYAPVFFLNGELKGHELIYLPKKDQFLPLKENWIDHLLSRQKYQDGNPTPFSPRELGVSQPDLQSLSVPPHHSKYGSDLTWWKTFTKEAQRIGRELLSKHDPGLMERIALPSLCSQSLAFSRLMKNACATYPTIKAYCDEIYGSGWLARSMENLKHDLIKKAEDEEKKKKKLPSLLEEEEPDKQWELSEKVTNKGAAATERVEVRVIEGLTITQNHQDLNDKEKEQLVRDGYLFRDHRKNEEVSQVYNVQTEAELSTIDDSGVYEVLTQPAKFEKLIVLCSPFSARGNVDTHLTIRPSGSHSWKNNTPGTVWAKPHTDSQSDLQEWFEGLSDSEGDSLSTGSTYVVLDFWRA